MSEIKQPFDSLPTDRPIYVPRADSTNFKKDDETYGRFNSKEFMAIKKNMDNR
ncbi:hypothetical protein HOG98_10125 [bacterium]|jgi:hypothetical protein|nr:hypothetical protein [bacterium]